MAGLWKDIRFGARMLRRTPSFTLTAVLVLALGIGANTAVFTFFNAVYLRPLPLTDPGRVVTLQGLSFPTYRDLAERVEGLSGLAARGGVSVTLDDGSSTAQVRAEMVTADYFGVLGVGASAGRTFSTAGDGGDPEVVLSHRTFVKRFGSEAGWVGKSVRLNGHPFTVVGVATAGFDGTALGSAPELWVPMTSHRLITPGWDFVDERGEIWLSAVGRLAAGVPLRTAQAQLDAVTGRLRSEHPDAIPERWALHTVGSAPSPIRDSLLPVLTVLAATVLAILLIGCANLANLLLARGSARFREMGIRLALGAKRRQLVRQLFVESLLLSLLGGAAGLLVASWLTDLGSTFLLGSAPHIDLAPDNRVLAFTLLISLLTATAFGLVPALQGARRRQIIPALGARDPSAGPGRSRLRSALVVGQVAVSLMLLVGSGLFLANLMALQAVDPGFDPANVLTFRLSPPADRYDAVRGRELYRDLGERIRRLPGVQEVSATQLVQLGFGDIARPAIREGQDPASGEAVGYNVIGPGYFRTLGMPLAAGREFAESDHADAPRVVIVNESLAAELWPGESPVGKRIHLPLEELGPAYEVVGIARDSKYQSLTEVPKPYLYLPFTQDYRGRMTVLVRSAPGTPPMGAAVREELRALDPGLPAYSMRALDEYIAGQLSQPRSVATTVTLFGVLAMALAAIGLYGVLSFSVVQRTREIGVRMALGASARDILRMVLGRGMALAAIGVGLGLAGAFSLTRLLRAMLFGVDPLDPASFLVAALLMSAVALLACYVPARSALRVDPAVALRYE